MLKFLTVSKSEVTQTAFGQIIDIKTYFVHFVTEYHILKSEKIFLDIKKAWHVLY